MLPAHDGRRRNRCVPTWIPLHTPARPLSHNNPDHITYGIPATLPYYLNLHGRALAPGDRLPRGRRRRDALRLPGCGVLSPVRGLGTVGGQCARSGLVLWYLDSVGRESRWSDGDFAHASRFCLRTSCLWLYERLVSFRARTGLGCSYSIMSGMAFGSYTFDMNIRRLGPAALFVSRCGR